MRKVDVNELLKNNLISDDQFNNIKSFYDDKDKGDTKNKTTLFLNILAGVLLALGIIWIVAANWNDIPGNVKIIVGMMLLLLSFGVTIYSKLKGKNLELQSLVFLGLAIGNVALISQTYHIMGDMRTFALLILVMLASIPFYTNSKVITFLYFICSNVYILTYNNFFINIDYTYNYNYDLGYILLFVISVLIMFLINVLHISFNKGKIFDLKLLLRDDNRRMLNLQTLSLVVLSVFICSKLDVFNATFFIIIVAGYFIAKMLNLSFQKRLYLIAFVISIFTFTFASYMLYNSFTNFEVFITVLYCILAVVLAIYYFIKRFRNDCTKIELFTIIALMIYTLQYALSIDITFVWSLYILIFAIHQMYIGINKKLIKHFNFGEAMFIILILRYLFEGDMSILLRGVICIIIAIIILIVNKYLNKNVIKKELNTKEEVK